jgi:hypothetical protein
MWGRLGPRFAVEAAFLILLAVGLGLADEDWVVIVAVMAAGWALVSVIELVASRRPASPWAAERAAPAEVPVVAEEVPSGPVAVEAPPPSAAEPEPEPVAPEPEPGAHPLPEPAPVGALPPAPPEDTVEVEPEDLDRPEQAEAEAPRRRWFRRRRQETEAEPAEEDAGAANGVSEPPKHVRKLEPDEAEARAAAESAEGH